MNPFEIVLKATVLLSAAGAAAVILRSRPAALRHLLWLAGIAGVLLLPFASITVPPVAVPALEPVAFTLTVSANETPEVTEGVRLMTVVFWTWATIAFLFVLRVIAGTLRLGLRSAAAETVVEGDEIAKAAGIRRPVRVAYSNRIQVPMTWGVLRPVVLLPVCARQWSRQRLDAVLAHEFGHVKRLDWLSQMLAHVACALYWFHPLVWYAAGRLRHERELACDDAVLAYGFRGSEYAGHLVDIVRGMLRENEIFSVGVAMAHQSNLETRVRAMLNPRLQRGRVTRRLLAGVAVATAVLLLPLTALRAPAQGNGGAISGTVFDASGAAVARARVTLINREGRNTELTWSSESGEYHINSLPPGRYDLHVAARGFAVFQQTGIAITGGSAIVQNATLQVGKVNETIEVVGEGTRAKANPPTATGAAPSRIRMGGSVQATRLVRMIRPSYPESAKARGVEGAVLLRAVIGRDGQVLNLETVNTQVDPELVTAATEAVRQWKYEPTLLNGEPVEVITEVTVNFTLEKNFTVAK